MASRKGGRRDRRGASNQAGQGERFSTTGGVETSKLQKAENPRLGGQKRRGRGLSLFLFLK